VLLRGGMLPQAYVYPSEMRATRDLLRRRIRFMRKRAELLTHVQQTNRQHNLPEIGKKIACKANRDGVAERFPEPAVQKSIAVDLALIGHYDHRLRDVELSVLSSLSPPCRWRETLNKVHICLVQSRLVHQQTEMKTEHVARDERRLA
jgi:hypothetical protein